MGASAPFLILKIKHMPKLINDLTECAWNDCGTCDHPDADDKKVKCLNSMKPFPSHCPLLEAIASVDSVMKKHISENIIRGCHY
jgi:hypothetical protein